MKKENNQNINDSKKIEDNDIDLSDLTDKAVFKGALNNLEDQKFPNPNQIKKNSHIINTPHNILQNLIKQENPNNNNSFQPNTSISSSGFISFRNKKARFVNLNNTNNTENKIDEEIDPKLITQSILIKLGTSGKPHLANSSFSKEGHLIESTKANEVEIDEKDLKVIHTNSSNNSNNNSNSEDSNNGDKNFEEEENEKNVFWNLNSHKDKINENFNLDIHDKKNESFKEQNKEKYLNTIICTLSMLEKGKAIFVSQEDMIFILPSFFVPKNLKIGNTYKFKVKEYFHYSKKTDEIQEIQKKYAK
jgi:hypothetical protein